MTKIIITEAQYTRIFGMVLTESNSFDDDLDGKMLKRYRRNNPEHVKLIQRMLKTLNYDLGNYGDNGVDGTYGSKTEEAVIEFQREEFPENEEEWDGVVGPKTYEKLLELAGPIDIYSDEEDEDIHYDGEDENVHGYLTIEDYLSKKDPMIKSENGNLTFAELTYIGTDTGGRDEYLEHEAAEMFLKMKDAALADGVEIRLTDAYRPCGRPGDFKKYNEGKIRFTQWAAWEQYNFNASLAAKPTPHTAKKWKEDGGGTCKSKHGLGRAVDIHGKLAKHWVKDNGEQYGWFWGDAHAEDWHFTYEGAPFIA